jgi:hypothetical protein
MSILTVLTFICTLSFSLDSSVSWKTNENMDDFIYKSDNVELIYLQNIPSFYELKRKVFNKDPDIDLYLSFDSLKDTDETDNYKVTYKKYRISENKAVYNKSAYFIGEEDRVELDRTGSSFFQPGINLGSFSICFWILPVSFSANETVIKIGSQYYGKTDDRVIDQSIVGKIEDGRFNWEFNNIFTNGKTRKVLVKVNSFSRIIPDQWTFVNLTFDSYKGIIREYINGRESGITTVTENGDIDSTVYNIKFDPTNRCPIKIGTGFEGALDEVYFIKNSKAVNPDRYDKKGGTILSNVLEIDRDGAIINKISVDDVKENNSDIMYYYRYSDKPFYSGSIGEAPGDHEPGWRIMNGENLNSAKVRFLQWKILLLPGTNGEFSPKFKGITINYTKDLPPSKPLGVKVLPGDHSVKIKWFPNSEKDVKGYKIYYGIKSGNYFGAEALEGASPVDVGLKTEFELTGLNNEIIYYIVITAYDDNNKVHESNFSDEVMARPLEKYGNKQ